MSGMKLGFTIAENVFGYGLVIPHYGTIVVGSGNRIGNYAVLHTSTCITAGKKNIGDGLYLSTLREQKFWEILNLEISLRLEQMRSLINQKKVIVY